MEQGTFHTTKITCDCVTEKLEELHVAHAQLRGLAGVLARCAADGAPLEALEAATLADALQHALVAADALLTEALVEHQLGTAQGVLNLGAAARSTPLHIVAGLDRDDIGDVS